MLSARVRPWRMEPGLGRNAQLRDARSAGAATKLDMRPGEPLDVGEVSLHGRGGPGKDHVRDN